MERNTASERLGGAKISALQRVRHACRVGTGVNDVERKTIDERLDGNRIEQKPAPAKYVAPRCYKVTGAKKERPDVWVKDPSRSIVLQVGLLAVLVSVCDIIVHVSSSADGKKVLIPRHYRSQQENLTCVQAPYDSCPGLLLGC